MNCHRERGRSRDESSDDEVVELKGDELLVSFQRAAEHREHLLLNNTPYTEMMRPLTEKDWKGIESNRKLGYNGQSGRTKRRKEMAARRKAEADATLRKR